MQTLAEIMNELILTFIWVNEWKHFQEKRMKTFGWKNDFQYLIEWMKTFMWINECKHLYEWKNVNILLNKWFSVFNWMNVNTQVR